MRCHVQAAVDVIGGRWKPGILFRLQDGPVRFADLSRQMSWISERVLVRQLRELERDGVVKRIDHRTRPPRVEYGLTEHGRSLGPLLAEIGRWARIHLDLAREVPPSS